MNKTDDRVRDFAAIVEASLPDGSFGHVQGLDQPRRLIRRQGFGLTWCSGATELLEQFPLLPQSSNDDVEYEGACIDLVVHLTRDGVLGDVSLGGWTIAETLNGLGVTVTDADLSGLDAVVAGPRLAASLQTVFASR